MAGMGNEMANSFLEYHVPSTWLKPSHLEPRDYRDAYIKVGSTEGGVDGLLLHPVCRLGRFSRPSDRPWRSGE